MPNRPVNGNYDGRHDNRCGKQQAKISRVRRLTDGRTQSNSRDRSAFEMKIFRDDAGVPCPTGGRHQARNEIWKDSRQD
jgi:hypothetical protein